MDYSMLVHHNPSALWHAALNEAQLNATVHLRTDTQAYLAALLMRFTQAQDLASSVLGLEFLTSYHLQGQQIIDRLQSVGDKCLLIAGLFPERAARRRVTVNYFIQLGQSAYINLAQQLLVNSAFYQQLSREFFLITKVLMAIRCEQAHVCYSTVLNSSLIIPNLLH